MSCNEETKKEKKITVKDVFGEGRGGLTNS